MSFYVFFFYRYGDHRDLHSFPTRRSSDLFAAAFYWIPKFSGRLMSEKLGVIQFMIFFLGFNLAFYPMHQLGIEGMPDRKSTRLNSSHGYISYAVFCLKKKKKQTKNTTYSK